MDDDAARINEALHELTGEEPCVSSCLHHLTGDWTLLGLANVAARAARRERDTVQINVSPPPPTERIVPVPVEGRMLNRPVW